MALRKRLSSFQRTAGSLMERLEDGFTREKTVFPKMGKLRQAQQLRSKKIRLNPRGFAECAELGRSGSKRQKTERTGRIQDAGSVVGVAQLMAAQRFPEGSSNVKGSNPLPGPKGKIGAQEKS